MLLKVGVVAAFASFFAIAAQAQSSFNVTFAGSTGQSTPLSITSGNETASFSSSSGPGTFNVSNTGLYSNIGAALGDYGSFTGDPLTIAFSAPVTVPVSLSFGIEDLFGLSGSDFLTLTTNLGFTENVTAAVSAVTNEPQGTATLSNPGFRTLTITSANPYAIGNVTSVPEPFTLSVMAVGLAGFAAARRRRG